MQNFLLHARRHLTGSAQADADRDIFSLQTNQLSGLQREMRLEGVWRHKSVYLIELNSAGLVSNHGKYLKSMYGKSIRGFPIVDKLISAVSELFFDGKDTLYCTQYGEEESERWACGVRFTVGAFPFQLIAGFDHAEDDPNITSFLTCSSASVVSQPQITAKQVEESQKKEDLKKFVGEAIKFAGTLPKFGNVSAESIVNDREKFLELTQNVLSSICLTIEGPWNFGSVYLFVMTAGESVVVLNGNNPELAGGSFKNVLDEDGKDINELIQEAAGEHGKSGFVEYKWDNPVVPGDEVNQAGKSPGTSPKISYVEGVRFGSEDDSPVYIFGSGIYPTSTDERPTSTSSDGGCAIAGVGSNFHRRGVFNLFLMVFFLSSGFCLRSRSRSKEN